MRCEGWPIVIVHEDLSTLDNMNKPKRGLLKAYPMSKHRRGGSNPINTWIIAVKIPLIFFYSISEFAGEGIVSPQRVGDEVAIQ